MASALFASCGGERTGPRQAADTADADLATRVVASEELILELTPRLNAFAPELFAPSCQFFSVGRIAVAEKQVALGVRRLEWSSDDAVPAARAPVIADLHAPLGELADGLPNPKFGIVSGRFTDDGRNRFETKIKADAQADRIWTGSEHSVLWERGGGAWRVTSWRVKRLTALEAPRPMFEEVLDQALPDAASRSAARTSVHQQILVENYFGNKRADLPAGYSDTRFYPDSVNMHPALSVVDIDRDGNDDLYVCVRWGKNQLLRNRGDGTFEECASRYGLDIDGRNTVALFADFDNDGDADLLLGRSLEQSLYLVNEGGRYSPATSPVTDGVELPWLVCSGSVADVNGDGLLDAYLCTYSPLDINTRIQGRRANAAPPQWAERFLPAEHAAEVTRRGADAHSYLGQVGPPNVLLINRGDGRFDISYKLAAYRNSFQGAWCDFDADGDQDLYVANDFSPDILYRNEGDGTFSDITAAAGIDTLAFGMGASWGDYDGDGYDDLYVSNMFSKAGRRVTSQIPGLDQRFVSISAGNFLYRNQAGKTLLLRSGVGENMPAQVHPAGWSWGGQFCDFDNDGRLDLYVSSGFYTPPPGLGNGVDL